MVKVSFLTIFFASLQTSNGFSSSLVSHKPSALSFGKQPWSKRVWRPLLAKKYSEDEIAVASRQRILTDAMNLLSDWDEKQSEFVAEHADSTAPLGDWMGLRKILNQTERVEMQKACKVLCEDAQFVLIGFNADKKRDALMALDEWLTFLELPKPPEVPYMDDICGIEYRSLSEMPDDFRQAMDGPVHVAYNSKAGADPATGDDSLAPPKAHIMPYPAPDRGVVFTPILQGFFTQYGDIPLDLYSPDASPLRAAAASTPAPPGPDLAARQHAELGSAEAARWVRDHQGPPAGQPPGQA